MKKLYPLFLITLMLTGCANYSDYLAVSATPSTNTTATPLPTPTPELTPTPDAHELALKFFNDYKSYFPNGRYYVFESGTYFEFMGIIGNNENYLWLNEEYVKEILEESGPEGMYSHISELTLHKGSSKTYAPVGPADFVPFIITNEEILYIDGTAIEGPYGTENYLEIENRILVDKDYSIVYDTKIYTFLEVLE